jgi:hypothetical protein
MPVQGTARPMLDSLRGVQYVWDFVDRDGNIVSAVPGVTLPAPFSLPGQEVLRGLDIIQFEAENRAISVAAGAVSAQGGTFFVRLGLRGRPEGTATLGPVVAASNVVQINVRPADAQTPFPPTSQQLTIVPTQSVVPFGFIWVPAAPATAQIQLQARGVVNSNLTTWAIAGSPGATISGTGTTIMVTFAEDASITPAGVPVTITATNAGQTATFVINAWSGAGTEPAAVEIERGTAGPATLPEFTANVAAAFWVTTVADTATTVIVAPAGAVLHWQIVSQSHDGTAGTDDATIVATDGAITFANNTVGTAVIRVTSQMGGSSLLFTITWDTN